MESQPQIWDSHVSFKFGMNPGHGETAVEVPEAWARKHGFWRFGLYWHYKPHKTIHFGHWRFIIIGVKWNLTGRKPTESLIWDSHVRLSCELHMWDLHWKSYSVVGFRVQIHTNHAFSRIYEYVKVKTLLQPRVSFTCESHHASLTHSQISNTNLTCESHHANLTYSWISNTNLTCEVHMK